MILRNVDALVGPSLAHRRGVTIRMAGGVFASVGPAARGASLDCGGLLAVPGLVNSHTHIGDSAAKDAGAGLPAADRIHPVRGAKRRILGSTPRPRLARYMARSAASMLRGGTTTFVDFREGGEAGIRLLREALARSPVRALALGRLEEYDSPERVRSGAPPPPGRAARLARLASSCDGIGISGPNENSDAALRLYSRARGIRAIHAAETPDGEALSRRLTGRAEAGRALLARPHVVVHMTQATRAQMRAVARATRGVVACPRANAALAVGSPDIAAMARAGCNVTLGTDNVMLNSPCMLAEMDHAWKSTMARERAPVAPADILRMATVNAGRMLRLRIGAISRGMAADCALVDMSDIDVEPAHDVHAAVVSRATPRAIRAVIIGGRIVHGRV